MLWQFCIIITLWQNSVYHFESVIVGENEKQLHINASTPMKALNSAYLSMSLHNGHQLTRALYKQFHNLTIEPANQPWSQSNTILHISLWFSHILSVSSSISSQSIPLTTYRDANNAMLQSAAFRTALCILDYKYWKQFLHVVWNH